MYILFNARVDAFIPGNFISWRIIPIPGQKTPAIEENYELINTGIVRTALNLNITNEHTLAYMPHVGGYERLKTAVFEIAKTDRKRFQVVRYVGELKVEHKIEPVTNTAVPKPSGKTHVPQTQVSRFADLDY